MLPPGQVGQRHADHGVGPGEADEHELLEAQPLAQASHRLAKRGLGGKILPVDLAGNLFKASITGLPVDDQGLSHHAVLAPVFLFLLD